MGGFSVPPPIRGGFEITPPDPYANLRALAMQGQIAQQRQGIATAQQEMQARGQQMQLVDQQIKDQQAIAQSLRERPDGESTEDFVKRAVDNGASGNAALGLVQHFADLRLKNAQGTEAELKAQGQRHEMLASQVQTILDAKTPEEKASRWAQYHPQMLRELDPGETIPGDLPDDDTLQGLRSGHMLTSEIAKENLEKAQAGQATAAATEATAKAKHQETINKLIDTGNQAVQNGRNPIDDIFPESLDKQTHDGYAAAWVAAGRQPPDENGRRPAQDQIVAAAASHAAEYQRATSPTIRAGEVQKAKEIEVATAPLKNEAALNLERSKLRLQQELSPDAFSGIANPQARAAAERAYQDYSNKFIDSMESAQGLHDLISQAQRGNKAAPGLISIAELRTYLNRVNRTELQAVGSHAGDLLDRIEGTIKGLTEGQPVPPDIMQGVDQIATMQQQAAQRKYGNQVGLMKTTYGKAPELFQWQPHANQQAQPAPAPNNGLPAVGGTFNGHKVLKVEKVQ